MTGKNTHFQLRLPSLPLRKPDPSQNCLHFQLRFSYKMKKNDTFGPRLGYPLFPGQGVGLGFSFSLAGLWPYTRPVFDGSRRINFPTPKSQHIIEIG